MIKKIYICDMCGYETVNENGFKWIKIFDNNDEVSYLKMICLNCIYDITKLIDNNYMVLDPKELRK